MDRKQYNTTAATNGAAISVESAQNLAAVAAAATARARAQVGQ